MKQIHIHIDRIQVRATGRVQDPARGLGEGLGQAIAEAMLARGVDNLAPVERIDVGAAVANGRDMSSLTAGIASRVVDAAASSKERRG